MEIYKPLNILHLQYFLIMVIRGNKYSFLGYKLSYAGIMCGVSTMLFISMKYHTAVTQRHYGHYLIFHENLIILNPINDNIKILQYNFLSY